MYAAGVPRMKQQTSSQEPTLADLVAVRALRSGKPLTQAALDRLEELTCSPKKLHALNLLLTPPKREDPTPPAPPSRSLRARNLTGEAIIEAAKAFYEIHKKLPTQHSTEPVPGMPHETWVSLDNAGSDGYRGLRKGQSLSKLLAPMRKELGIVSRGDKVDLSDEVLRSALHEHYQLHGSLPHTTCREPAPGLGGMLWRTIFRASYDGLRGFGKSRRLQSIIQSVRDELGLKRRREARSQPPPR